MIISVVNNKGGVSKTTTVINLGHALSLLDRRVLVVDMDHQANLSTQLRTEDRKRSLYELMDPTDTTTNIEDCIYPTLYRNLEILPNIEETAILEPYIMDQGDEGRNLLRNRFREYALERYDYVLIDNAPALGVFVLNALRCSDFVIVPISPGSKHSVTGLLRAITFIDSERQGGNPDLQFLRLLVTSMDKRKSIHKDRVARILNTFPEGKAFSTIIPTNTAVEKADERDRSVIDYDSRAPASKAYRNLAQELIGIVEA